MQPHETYRAARVSLRAAQRSDAALLKHWRAESSIRRFQPLGTFSLSQLATELAEQRMEDLYRGRGDKFQWIVRCEGQPAGWITLVVTNWEHGLAETGYALATRYQHRGLMAQALDLLLADLFLNTALMRIEARCSLDNIASQKILEKVGFRREGRLRGYFVLAGERVDNYLYAILRQDYLPS